MINHRGIMGVILFYSYYSAYAAEFFGVIFNFLRGKK